MSYRSIKRVLGERNLERKCSFFFALCLGVLIALSLYINSHRTEKIIDSKSRDTGRHLVDAVMLKYHWLEWESNPSFKGLVARTSEDLENLKYDYRFLALTPPPEDKREESDVHPPEDAEERAILHQLKRDYETYLAELKAGAEAEQAPAEPPAADEEAELIKTSPSSIISQHRRVDRDGAEYHYYQAVVWKRSCTICHNNQNSPLAPVNSSLIGGQPPFRVVKVVIPDGPTQRAVAHNYAILLAMAIFTFFLALVLLHLVVRYVIVKPLYHLRDVSDEVSRGNTELRAEIHTNDEFEELADSFNRMLHHLVDAQNELRRLNTDLDNKVDELAQVNIRLYEMNRLKSEFLANMSHELRTPLNSINGFAEVLEGIESLTPKQKRYAGNIKKSGNILLHMINDILDLAKLEAGKMQVRPSEFRIDLILQAQCDMVRSLTDEKNIDLETHVSPGAPPMYQDQSKVQQILNNLLSNAIKFTPEGGRIDVSARRTEENDLELTVADTGVGIAEEDKEIIFEKFRQSSVARGADNLTREYSGTGLGLSIIKELCKLLGGEIRFESELGKGSEFTVTLPWRRSEPPPRRDVSLAAKLDDLTKPRRVDFEKSTESNEDAAMARSTK